MTIRKGKLLACACTVAIAANSFAGLSVVAQEKKQEETKRTVIIEQSIEGKTGTFDVRVPGPPNTIFTLPPQGFGGVWVGNVQGAEAQTFSFVSTEMSFDGKVVTGAPFSAETVTEFTQVLGDGNRIVRRSVSNFYRDSQGRTRREQMPFAMGPLAGNIEQQQRVFIIDPVGNTTITLDTNSRIAFKSASFAYVPAPPPPPPPSSGTESAMPRQPGVPGGALQGSAIKRVQPSYPPVAKAAGAEGSVQVQITINENGDVTEASAINGHPLLRDSAVAAARQWKFKPTEQSGQAVRVQGVLTFNFVLDRKPDSVAVGAPIIPGDRLRIIPKNEVRSESLGKQTIEGVEAEGTRTVETVPAGAIGNERPIEVINERWYSPELQTVIMTRHNDPRFGETVFKLTNINRSEPDASLFQIPSDYTVKEGSGFGGGTEIKMRRRNPNEQ